MRQITAFAIGQFSRQDGDTGTLALLDFLTRLLPRLGGLDRQFSQFFAVFNVLVQPQFQAGTDKARHQSDCVARVQTFLDLPLKLGVQHLGRQDVAGTRENIFRQQLDALGQQGVEFDKTFDGGEQAVAQAAFMGAAIVRRDQIDITFAHRLPVFRKGNTPGGTFALGKVVALRIGKALAFEDRDHQFTGQRLTQVVTQPTLENPVLRFLGFFIGQRDTDAGHQHRLAAQQMCQRRHRQGDRLEVLGVGPDPHRGT